MGHQFFENIVRHINNCYIFEIEAVKIKHIIENRLFGPHNFNKVNMQRQKFIIFIWRPLGLYAIVAPRAGRRSPVAARGFLWSPGCARSRNCARGASCRSHPRPELCCFPCVQFYKKYLLNCAP
jgi:hypothetical protein